jgi:hypothetical protein
MKSKGDIVEEKGAGRKSAATAEEKRAAYIGVRHLAPRIIRSIRLALDLGSTPADVAKTVKKACRRIGPSHLEEFQYMASHTPLALQYMVDNPKAGVIRIVDGDDHWVWRDDEEAGEPN